MKPLAKILIIAGSDPSGGAGLQTDLKTATNHKTYASAAPTCLTVQNTQKVSDIFNPNAKLLEQQLESLFSDIKYDAIKIGMVGDLQNIRALNKSLDKYAKNIPIILDPVMVATSGDKLFDQENILELQKLIKKAFLITPNINEAEILANQQIKSTQDIIEAAKKIKKIGAQNIFIKAGHLKDQNHKITNILLDNQEKITKITNKKVKTGEIHGTGCSLATAICCNISKGYNLVKSVKNANNYIYRQIKKSQKVGQGSNILTHF